MTRLDSPLCDLVPKGSTYGYDLIAHVGCETFLRGRKLEEVARDLPRTIPFSTLFDLQHKFLFYFGHVHRQGGARDGRLFSPARRNHVVDRCNP